MVRNVGIHSAGAQLAPRLNPTNSGQSESKRLSGSNRVRPRSNTKHSSSVTRLLDQPGLAEDISCPPKSLDTNRSIERKLAGAKANLRRNYEATNRKRRLKELGNKSGIAGRSQIRKQRSLRRKRRIRCKLCPKEEPTWVNDRRSLADHQLKAHKQSGGKPAYFCGICELSFNGEKQEIQHKSGKNHKKAINRRNRRAGHRFV